MKAVQFLGAAALLFQLAAGGEVFAGARYRRTLFSNPNAGEQLEPAAAAAIQGASSSTNVTAAANSPPPPPPPPGSTPSPPPPKAVPSGAVSGAAAGIGSAAVASGGAPAAAANSTAGAASQIPIAEIINTALGHDFNLFIIGSVLIMILYRLSRQLIRYIRTLTSLNYPRQEYFYEPSENFAMVKKHIIHAPMFKHRRAQESRPHPKIHGGALPTRAQALYLVVYLLLNVALSVVFIQWELPLTDLASQIKNRTGVLAIYNFAPMIFLAGRENPLIGLTHLPFDTFNTFHRWFGRMTVLLVVVHASAFFVSVGSKAGFQGIVKTVEGTQFILAGFITSILFLTIIIQASSPIRHAAYEMFKMGHIVLVALVFVGLYFHLSHLPQIATLAMAASFWAVDRVVRVIMLLKANAGKNGSRAHVEALPGDAVRVTLELARPWKFQPGQHLYLYMPALSYFQSHPFSVAWASTETEDVYPTEKLLENRPNDIKTVSKTKFQLIIKQRGGFTKRLVQKAQNAPDGKFSTFAWAEGPLGGHNTMESYGTAMLFAGGVGITHMVPYIQQLVTCHARNTTPTKKIVLVWVIPRPDALNWIAPWMQEILHIEGRRECLRLLIYITKLGPNEKVDSPSATIQIIAGRPDVGAVLDWECEPLNQVGAMGVSVCGGGALADDVRQAVRDRQLKSNIDFVEESFTW